MIQCQCLNYILSAKDSSCISSNNLSSEYFSEYKDEFEFIKSHIDEYGNVPDTETFIAKFPDFDLVEVNESVSYLMQELYNDRNKRKLAGIFNTVRSLLMEDKTSEAMNLYMTAADNLVTASKIQSVDIFDNISRYEDYLDRSKDFSSHYVKTGFPELDRLIGGWDRNDELATIVARPGLGKTWTLLKTALAAAESGLTVGIYSGEMTETKVGYRIDTLMSHISNRSITQGDISVSNDYKRYLESAKSSLKGTIKVLTPKMVGGPVGVNALRAFIERDHLDMLCIDQHSLLEDDRKAKNPVEKASNISKDLKNLQVMKRIPIIAVSQQNRVVNENGVDTTNVAQSDRIAQDSTVVIFLEKCDNSLMKYNLVKSRDSESGKSITYSVDLDKGIFTYIPEGQLPDDAESLKEEYESGEEVF